MPLRFFNCPDGITREISECLEHCPRAEGRCLSLPTLHEVGRARVWKGMPSTTQLLNPVRMEYLKIKYDYAINPFDMAFALLGTRHHSRLEHTAKLIEGLQPEKRLQSELNTGILDLLEPDELYPNCYKLWDMKTFGSYAVAKVAGLSNNGDDEIRRVTLQTNNYRVMAEEELGIKVSRILLQVTVRDGGTWVAKKNGVDDRMLVIPLEILPDDEVKEYFLTKAYLLCTAIEKDEMPKLCEFPERWNGRRCSGFCEVFSYCPEGAMINKVPLKS